MDEFRFDSTPEAVLKADNSPDMSMLSAEEKQAVLDFSEKIDITNTTAILQYGASSQKSIADFSSVTLNTVRARDMGEIGGLLSELVIELKDFDSEEEKKGLFGFKRKLSRRIAALKTQYAKVEVTVDKIAEELNGHRLVLLKDISMLDKMYEINRKHLKEISMYILAGKTKLTSCINEILPVLRRKAQESGLPEDAQAVSDYENLIKRFEKKLHDLELTKTISVRAAPQIRILYNNDSILVEKLQASLSDTIPLWKKRMALSLGLSSSGQAAETQKTESKTAETETLRHTNRILIETLEEVHAIQDECSVKRREAEAELGRIEDTLRQKLLNLKK